MILPSATQSGHSLQKKKEPRSVCAFMPTEVIILSLIHISIVKASTYYGTKIHASVEKGNVFACQFHPEKSGETGLRILKNFVQIGREEA